jgi:hypothetical protein
VVTSNEMASRRSCKLDPDQFCYICGRYGIKSQLCKFTEVVKEAYRLYFGFSISHQDKPWAPHVCCVTCSNRLRDWYHDNGKPRPFYASPAVWTEPRDHDDCYFCKTKIANGIFKGADSVTYPEGTSATKAVAATPDEPIFPRLAHWNPQSSVDATNETTTNENTETTVATDASSLFVPPRERGMITQPELNDMVRDLYLSKEQAQLMGSRLSQFLCVAGVEAGVQ